MDQLVVFDCLQKIPRPASSRRAMAEARLTSRTRMDSEPEGAEPRGVTRTISGFIELRRSCERRERNVIVVFCFHNRHWVTSGDPVLVSFLLAGCVPAEFCAGLSAFCGRIPPAKFCSPHEAVELKPPSDGIVPARTKKRVAAHAWCNRHVFQPQLPAYVERWSNPGIPCE